MAKVLVTGGCGFIGSHLCAALAAAGHDVRILDDLSTGWLVNCAPGTDLVVGCVTDPVVVGRAMEGVEACFHLAAIASVQRGTEAWAATHRLNLSGTINILDAARASGVPVIYASSAAVYGIPDRSPLTEDSRLQPLSAYGADKLGCEQHARVAGVVHGVRTFGLRFFNVFGTRQDPHSPYSGVISIFCERLAKGLPVMLHGDGGQLRDFVHVSDVVRALLAAWGAASVEAPVVNVCTGRPTSIRELAHAIAGLLGREPRLLTAPARAGDIRESLGSAMRLERDLGVRAETTLGQGLAGILEWLRAGAPGIVGGADQPKVRRLTAVTTTHSPSDMPVRETTAMRSDQRWS